MPNWCTVQCVVEGNAEDIKKIESAIKESDEWEGNTLEKLNIPIQKENYLRGFIDKSSVFYENGKLYFNTDDAWDKTDFYKILCEYLDIIIWYQAEEPGLGYYATNDMEGVYFSPIKIELYINNIHDSEYFDDKEEAFDWVSEIVEEQISSEEDIVNYNKNNKENYIHLIEYKYENL